MAKIQQIKFPLNLGTANDLLVRSAGFNMSDKTCRVYWELRYVSPPESETGNFKSLSSGILYMDEAAFDAWGADNQYVVDWVAQQLGVTLI